MQDAVEAAAAALPMPSKSAASKAKTLLWGTGAWWGVAADAYLTDTELQGALSSRWSLLSYASALRELLDDPRLSGVAGLPQDAAAAQHHRRAVERIAGALEACSRASCSKERDELLEEDPDRELPVGEF